MTVTTTIPVDLTPEAAARIEELGMQCEVDQMLEHTRQAVSGLIGIELTVYYHPDEPEAHVMITGWRSGVVTSVKDYSPADDWDSWFIRTFPPDVFRWFSFWLHYREEHGR